jgi:glyoxylate reductase
MKRGAIFINTARGGIVDQDALCDALERGEIAGAGLDVMTPEPLPVDAPLLRAPNLVVTPHVGSATLRTRERMAELAIDGLLAGCAGERPKHFVNPEAWAGRRTG